MTLIFIAADDQNGYFNAAANTDVFVKAGVILGSQDYALSLTATGHDITVQGAVVGGTYGIEIRPNTDSIVSASSLSIADGGLVSGAVGARLAGSGNHVTNHGDIMGQGFGLAMAGNGGASAVENFGLISAKNVAFSVGDYYSQALTFRNSGEIAGGTYSYVGSGGIDTVINRGVMDGRVLLNSGNDFYKGALGQLEGSINGGAGLDQILCGDDDNSVSGGSGSDQLRGGAGEDQFYFNSTLGASNVDTIRDFRSVDDRIMLDNGFFTQIAGTGSLSSAQFAANASGVATQADDRIVYETDTGRLIYDSNGSAAGGATQFAVLSGAPNISATDFFVY